MPLRYAPNAEVPYYLVLFDEDGHERPESSGEMLSTALLDTASQGVTDIFILSHGWKGDIPAAVSQYDAWVDAMAAQIGDRARVRQFEPKFTSLVVGVHWPSLPWGLEDTGAALLGEGLRTDDDDLVAEGNLSSPELIDLYAARLGDTPQCRADLGTTFSAAEDPPPDFDPENILVPEGLLEAYQSLFEKTGLARDGCLAAPGSDQEAFDPAAAMAAWLGEASPTAEDGGLLLGGVDGISLADFKSVLLGPVRQLSFWTMKKRGRTVGERGVHELVAALQKKARGARIHLMGHSFGCIVVSSAILGPMGGGSPVGRPLLRPVDSVLLVQGALSLWSYASQVPFSPHSAGYFRPLLEDPSRVRGPLVATFSSFDKAVGTFYPVGAAIGNDFLLSDDLPKFGALGAFGMQAAGAASMSVLPPTAEYKLETGGLYNVDASSVIANGSGASGAHNDIVHPETAHLMWEAVIATVPA